MDKQSHHYKEFFLQTFRKEKKNYIPSKERKKGKKKKDRKRTNPKGKKKKKERKKEYSSRMNQEYRKNIEEMEYHKKESV